MSKTSIDSNLDHLYPVFRQKLEKVLAEVKAKTGFKWVMTEGFRSDERQLWLYASGRTRPGPWLTSMRTPKNHGAGLAADCYPTSDGHNPNFSIGKSVYETFRKLYQAEGLGNGAWGKGDMGHVEFINPELRQKALAWVRAGFPADGHAPLPFTAPTVRVYADGHEVINADASLEKNHVVMALRPVTDALGWVIESTTSKSAHVVDDTEEITVPIDIRNGVGYVLAKDLAPLALKVTWVGESNKLFLVDRHPE